MRLKRSLVSVVILSCVLCINFISAWVPPELLKLCRGTEDPALCARTILPTLHGRLDPYQALVAEINATARYTRKAIGIINTQMAMPNNPKTLSDCLSICKGQYESILDSIETTLPIVAKKAMYDACVSFSAVISYQQTGEDAFKESEGVVFSFARQSKRISQLAGNCLDIMAAFQNSTN